MARTKLTVARDMRYGTRMLTAGDPLETDGPRARLFQALGWAEQRKMARRPQLDHDENGKEGGSSKQTDDLTVLRAEYAQKVGKRPFNGWGAAELRERMKAAG